MNHAPMIHAATTAACLLCAGAGLGVLFSDHARAQSRDDIRRIQQALVIYGAARTDGILDHSTKRAIKAYQRDWELAVTGRITQELVARLSREHPATRPQWRKVTNQDCAVWSARPAPRELIEWSGACSNGRARGNGVLRMSWSMLGQTMRIVFSGDYKDGRANGRGRMVYASGDRYAGQFKNGHRSGLGRYLWQNGTEYRGYFEQGYRHGNGIATFTNGDRYAGRWQHGKPHGNGIYYPARGEAEERNWTSGCSTYDGRNRWLFTSRQSCGF